MTPLDPTTARLFPSLARYARRQRWLGWLAVAGIIYVMGFWSGLLVGSYRGQVADESYTRMVYEFNQFKEDYLKHHVKQLTVTKAAAQVITQQREDARRGGE